MNKLLLTLCLCCGFLFGYSQYYYNPSNPVAGSTPAGNPGGLNDLGEFPLGGGLDASWTSILGGGQTTPTWSPTQTLPFAFDFNGSPVTQYKVSSSGVLTFDVAAANVPSGNNSNIPSVDIPDNSVVVWGLAGIGGNDNIVVQTFGTAPNRQHWVFFSSYNYDGGGATCWHYFSIVLEESSNHIYIVDQRHTTSGSCVPSLTLGIQIDNTTAVEIPGSPNYSGEAEADGSDADNIFYQFIPGTRPDYDLATTALDLGTYLPLANAPFTFGATFQNFGGQNVTSFDINYSVDGGAAVASTITGLNMALYDDTDASIQIPWTPPALGTYNIKIWPSNINGNPDAVGANDTLSKDVEVIGPFIPRRLLHEDFTSSSCPPCLPGGIQLRSVMESFPDSTYTFLSYAMSWPSTGDPYYTEEGNTRRNYYGITSIPRLELDGGWDGNPNSYTDAEFNSFQEIPAYMSIDATYSVDSLSPVLSRVDVEVTITPMQDFPSNSLRLFVGIFEVLTENNTSNDNPNGETEWHHYMKKMLPDGNGSALSPLTANTPVTLNFSHFFQGNYRLPFSANDPINVNANEHSVEEFSDLGVSVFVQDITTMEVHQSNYADILCNDITMLTTSFPDNGTNNGAIRIDNTVGGVNYSYSLNGVPIFGDSVGNLPSGDYNLTVTDGYGCTTTDTVTASNVGIEDLADAGINLMSAYPNPTDGVITVEIELEKADDLEIRVFDVNGKVVFRDERNKTKAYFQSVNLTDLPAGVYILTAQTSLGRGSQRIVIK